jgi:hypothetical protein
MFAVLYFVKSRVGTVFVIGRSPVPVLPKCLKGFRISEVTSESEQARRPNP